MTAGTANGGNYRIGHSIRLSPFLLVCYARDVEGDAAPSICAKCLV